MTLELTGNDLGLADGVAVALHPGARARVVATRPHGARTRVAGRRIARPLAGHHGGLAPFLAPQRGVPSDVMPAQDAAAAVVSESESLD